MAEGTTLDAAEVRSRLLTALQPVLTLVAIEGFDPSALRYVVQTDPLLLQLVLPPSDGRKARTIAAFPGYKLPDRGAALRGAVEALAAGTLAAMPPDSATAAVLNAAAAGEGGGLCVHFNPTDQSATLFLAKQGESLDRGVVLGGLGDAPETMH